MRWHWTLSSPGCIAAVQVSLEGLDPGGLCTSYDSTEAAGDGMSAELAAPLIAERHQLHSPSGTQTRSGSCSL